MEKNLTVVLFVLWVASGCGIFPWNAESEKDPDPVRPIAAVEKEPRLSNVPMASDPAVEGANPPARTRPRAATEGEIRRLQETLKVSGFDPGPVDGMFGSKTRAAFLKLKSGCATIRRSAAQLGGDRTKIRMLQTRLKDAGFDPGVVDGIAGPNTRAAVVRSQTGCTAYKNFSPNVMALIDNPSITGANGTLMPKEHAPRDVSRRVNAGRPEALKVKTAETETRSNEEVRSLQLRLKNAGFDPGPVDGIMGPRTQLAAKKFQNSQEVIKSQVSAPATDRTLQY